MSNKYTNLLFKTHDVIVCFIILIAFSGCGKTDKSNSLQTITIIETQEESETFSTSNTPSPSPTPTPVPKLVQSIKYESVAGDWVAIQIDDYDENGNVFFSKIAGTDNGEISYEYDEKNLLVRKLISYDSGLSDEFTYSYDDGLLISSTETSDSAYFHGDDEFTYEYNNDVLISVTRFGLLDYKFEVMTKCLYDYDDEGRLIKKTLYSFDGYELGEELSTTTYEYGKSGNLVREVYVNSTEKSITTYEYDDNGMISKEIYDSKSYSIYISDEYKTYEYEYIYE